jgi:hypothetical protein
MWDVARSVPVGELDKIGVALNSKRQMDQATACVMAAQLQGPAIELAGCAQMQCVVTAIGDLQSEKVHVELARDIDVSNSQLDMRKAHDFPVLGPAIGG